MSQPHDNSKHEPMDQPIPGSDAFSIDATGRTEAEFDAIVQSALRDVTAPAGLQARLLSALYTEADRYVESEERSVEHAPTVERSSPMQPETPTQANASRRWWLLAALGACLALLAAFPLLTRKLTPTELAERAVFWLERNDAESWQLASESIAPELRELSSVLLLNGSQVEGARELLPGELEARIETGKAWRLQRDNAPFYVLRFHGLQSRCGLSDQPRLIEVGSWNVAIGRVGNDIWLIATKQDLRTFFPNAV